MQIEGQPMIKPGEIFPIHIELAGGAKAVVHATVNSVVQPYKPGDETVYILTVPVPASDLRRT